MTESHEDHTPPTSGRDGLRKEAREFESLRATRKSAQEAFKNKPEFASAVLDAMGALVLVRDAQGRIVTFNRVCQQVMGYSLDEVRGRRVWDMLLTATDSEKVKGVFNDIVAGNFPSACEHHWVTKDKRRLLIAWTNTAMVSEDGSVEYVISTGTDVTELKQAEGAVARRNAVLHAIRNVNETITRERDPVRLVQKCCNNLIGTRGCNSAWIALVDPDGELATVAQASLDETSCCALEMLRQGKMPPCGRQALRQTDVQLVPPAGTLCSDCPRQGPRSDKTAMLIGLKHEEREFGLMAVSLSADLASDSVEQSLMTRVAADIAFALDKADGEKNRKRAEKELQQSVGKLGRVLDQTVGGLAAALEQRDPYTAGHQERVARLACAIAQDMKLPKDQITGLRMAAAIHDVGKIHVPAEILAKITLLSDPEYAIIKSHPQIGYDVLKNIEFPWPVADIVLQHHERINGSAYPSGLPLEDLLVEARIVAVADVVEAMASHRPYHPALGIDAALSEISDHRGILYDPYVADVCLELFEEKGFVLE